MIPEIESVREKLIDDFGLPSWIERNCSICDGDLFLSDMIDIGIDFSKKNFGNIVFGMHCKYCGSLEEYVATVGCLSIKEVLEVFEVGEVEVISRQESLVSLENNITNYIGDNMAMIKRSTTMGFVQRLSASEDEVSEDELVCCCPECGTEYDDPEGPFCPKCGSRLENYAKQEDRQEYEDDVED
jgi:hypothetical protein